ncbi:hypothetical protein SADUNF_Sadunf03G0022000 [Salix dunnii]|uniref:Uncharacterized protein n=1 Tax=Salix dunnii TaxID=1413687 RepID=A0A835KFN6_9ROSI|nr:hypothetical protein SADUNF_Sadunf03G0022000 [Salix dunnii]
MNKGHSTDAMNHREEGYVPIRDVEDAQLGMFDKPLPCFGCGIGWFFLLLGFVFPLMWYFSAILYFGKYYNKDPRERSGLAACAIAKRQCYDAVTVHVRAEHAFFNHINTVTVNYDRHGTGKYLILRPVVQCDCQPLH